MGLLESLLSFKPDSILTGVDDAIYKSQDRADAKEKAAAGLALQKMQLEIRKAELENRKNETKSKKNDYFWSALDKASKFKGKTRSSIMKAVPAIIQDMTGQAVSPEVAQAFLDMANDQDNGLLEQIDWNRVYSDPDYRFQATNAMINAGMAENSVDAIAQIDKFFGPEKAQARANAALDATTIRERSNVIRNRENIQGKKEVEEIKTKAENKKAADKEDNEFAKRAENYITDPNWYKQWATATPEERVQMRSELTPIMKKADTEARKFGSKQIEIALKTETDPARVYLLNKLLDPAVSDTERSLGERIRDENLAKSAEGQALLDASKSAKETIGLGGGQGMDEASTQALLKNSKLPQEQKNAIAKELADKKRLNEKKAQKAPKGAAKGMTAKQSFDIVQKLQEKADKYAQDSERLRAARTITGLIKNTKGPILEQSIIPQYMNMVANAPSILRPEELKVFYSNQGIAGTAESYVKRMKGEGGLSKPSLNEIKKVAVLFEKLALKSYRERLVPIENEAKLQGVERGRIFSPEIEGNIAAYELSNKIDTIKSGKKIIPLEQFKNHFRAKGKSDGEIKRLIEKAKADGARFQ